MSRGRFSTPPLAPEDDWFIEPEARPPVGREKPREPRTSHPGPPAPQPESERDMRILVAAIAGAVILLVVGVLIARAIAGSDGGAEATTTAPPTTATTTPTTPTTTPTTTTPTTTTPTTTPTTLPEGVTLRRGDSGEEVRQVQAALVELGYSTGGVEGKFGPATEEAVLAFQKASGLKEDGIVGPATLAALSAAQKG
ncbi:MAG TPA: peptidoglycan-binding domain-containing protein [Gaiellaceae bacterium]|nr:peptidoglycan-binding domain-containing protein [Gaiellaceae bacterium]